MATTYKNNNCPNTENYEIVRATEYRCMTTNTKFTPHEHTFPVPFPKNDTTTTNRVRKSFVSMKIAEKFISTIRC